jgi:hypothetical protein
METNMQLTFRALGLWPGKLTERRKRAMFRANYNATLRLLDFELRKLGASDAVLQVALDPREIRLDGLPRADARPMKHPGVVLSFQSRYGPLSYPCDTFDQWEDNLRAIALALEHLRAVDRFGVTKRGEQYTGWTALPYKNAVMGREDAADLLARLSKTGHSTDRLLGDPAAAREAYRSAALNCHPDRNGGQDDDFKKLQDAKEVLGL